ncbi:hypothetical protein CMO83_04375 [Candidatus Woesearchaeota archaeon]|jgi:chromosome segregation ATPase|nr:hypothetical protein [Candidatus Woesearchaeota archaeon]|tara:strand:- start:9620 stop:10102 length:483 start_codon:yes stop_codon:yes gene_type:complete
MDSQSKSLRHFTKHVFLIGNVYLERNKAKQDVHNQLERMRKSIIRINLSYSDVDRLRKKIDNLIHWERKYAKFFKPDDTEAKGLKNEINSLEQELKGEREEKMRIISDNNDKIDELNESLKKLKSRMHHHLIEKSRRKQRLNALDKKINEKVDANKYFHS